MTPTSEEISLAASGRQGLALCSDSGGSGAPARLETAIDLDTDHRPKFVRVTLRRNNEQTERGVLYWDGEPLGQVNAWLAEECRTDLDLSVSPAMSFGAGPHTLTCEIPGPAQPVRRLEILALHIPADDEESLLAKDPTALEFYTITSHQDFAWRHSRRWHVERYVKAMRAALDLVRRYPHYVFQVETMKEQLVPFMEWAERNDPALIEVLKDLLNQGRLEVVCALSNPRLTEVYPETIVRNMVLGRRWFRGMAPDCELRLYNTVDLMPGCSQMPQICRLGGYSYFLFTRPMGRQVVFRWVGLDGTSVIASRSGYSIGHDLGGITPACARLFRPPLERVMIGHDDSVPDEDLARDSQSWDPSRRKVATVLEYMDEVAKYADRLDAVGPILDSLCTYCTAGLQGVHNLYLRNNRSEDPLLLAESLQLMDAGLAGRCEHGPIEPFWQDLFENTGHALAHVFAEDFEDRSRIITGNREGIRNHNAAVLDSLLGRLDGSGLPGRPLIAANRLGWPRTDMVTVAKPEGVYAVRDERGDPVECEADGDAIRFIARDVPSCGYKTYCLVRQDSAAPGPEWVCGGGSVENEFFRVEADGQGRLAIVDKTAGRALTPVVNIGVGDVVFRPASPPENGWVMLGPYGEAVPCAWAPDRTRSRVGPVRQMLQTEGAIDGSRITRTVTLCPGVRRVDFEIAIDSRDKRDGVFRFAAPLDFEGELTAGIPFGAEPRKDFDKELFREEFFVRGYDNGYFASRWTDWSSDDFGVTFVCPRGAWTGYEFDRDSRMFEFTFLRTRSTDATAGGVGTPHMYGLGAHAFTCALAPHRGTWRDAAAFRNAFDLHNPLAARAAPAGAVSSGGSAPLTQSFVLLEPDNVVLSSARLTEDGDWELRLYETVGEPVRARVDCPRPPREARLTDFNGQPLAGAPPAEIRDGAAHFALGPWQIANLRLSF